MSPRDCFWFLAGALIALALTALVRWWLLRRRLPNAAPPIPSFTVPLAAGLALLGVAFGIYVLLGSADATAPARGAVTDSRTRSQEIPIVPAGDSMPADPTQHSAGASTGAGSLDEVTRRLAERLATRGGTDSEWQLLAQSYDYMGRPADAASARSHKAPAPRAAVPASDGPMQAPIEQIAAVADSLESRPPATAPGRQR